VYERELLPIRQGRLSVENLDILVNNEVYLKTKRYIWELEVTLKYREQLVNLED
jgi:hypothetical protein